MIWLGFIGASLTSAKGAHLRPEIADKLWRGVGKKIADALAQLITAAFCLGMAYLAYRYVMESKAMGDVSVVTGIPLWIVQLAIPYTFASMALRHFAYSIMPAIRPITRIEDQK